MLVLCVKRVKAFKKSELRYKMSSLLNYAPYVLSCLTCYVPYVPLCLTCLVPYVLSCLTCLVPYAPRAKRALVSHVSYVLLYLTCLLPCVFSGCLKLYMLFCSFSSVVLSLTCSYASRAL